MVEFNQMSNVDGVLVGVPEKNPYAGLELAPARLCDLIGRLKHLPHRDGEAGVQLEDHLLHKGREVLTVRPAYKQRPFVRGQIIGSPPVEKRIALCKSSECDRQDVRAHFSIGRGQDEVSEGPIDDRTADGGVLETPLHRSDLGFRIVSLPLDSSVNLRDLDGGERLLGSMRARG